MCGPKGFVLLCMVLMSLDAFTYAGKLTPRGASKELSDDSRKEALELLDSSLAKLTTGDGPNYKVVKVTSVKGQTVAGTLNTFEVELANGDQASKECIVTIWTQLWLTENGTNIKIKCNGNDSKVDQTW